MLPIQDVNPTRRLPILTYILIGVNVLFFLWELTLSETQLMEAFQNYAVVPANFSAAPFSIESILDGLRSMFFHGGFEHIIGNMLFLWLFGDNLEDRLGAILYLIVYFVSGFVAIFAQVAIDPTSQIPLIGASGAIAGVLGGYLVLFPGVTVRALIPVGRISTLQNVPAFIVLGMWFVLQLISGFASLGVPTAYGGGVAFFAHIGGFIAGALMVFLYSRLVPQPPVEQRRQMLYQRAPRYWF